MTKWPGVLWPVPPLNLFSRCVVSLELLRDGFEEHKFYHCFISDYITSTETTPVGYGLYFFTYSTWEGRTLYIEDIYIDPKHRSKMILLSIIILFCIILFPGKGLATSIMKECAKVCGFIADKTNCPIRVY